MKNTIKITFLLLFLFTSGKLWSQCTPGFTFSASSLTVTFTNTTTGSAPNAYWSFGDGSTSYTYSPTYTYFSAGTYWVCVEMYDAAWSYCGTFCDSVTVAPTCTSSFTWSAVGGAVTFVNTSTGLVDSVWWDFGDGFTSDSLSPHHTYTSPGWYYVCMTPFDSVGASCAPSYCEWVNIGSLAGCVSSYTYTMTGATVDFTNTSTGPWASVWWDFGDGWTSSLPNPSHTYATAGSFYACLYTYDSSGWNCDGGYCEFINIPVSPTGCSSSYTYATGASGDTIFFTNTSAGGASTYVWDFGDGTTSTDTNAVHAYTYTGWFYVCLYAQDTAGLPCDYGYCQYIYAVGTGSVCSPSFTFTTSTFTGVFTNTSTGGIWYYVWDFGDGFTSGTTDPVHTYSVAGTYLVCLTAYDWYGYVCDTAYCEYVTVGPVAPPCYSFFSYTSSGTTLSYDNESVGYTSAVSWDFGDGGTSTLDNPVHTYSSPGWYYVCMYAIDSLGAACDSGYCDWVFVDGCSSSFTYSVSGSTATFYNTSFGGVSASWDFGDGATSTTWSPVHTYAGPGTYNACLTVFDASGGTCGSYCLAVDMGTAPTCGASFTSADSSGYKVFISTSSGSSAVSSYSWDFGDGSTSIMKRPFHYYATPGVYNVCLTITTLEGCSDTHCEMTTVTVGTDDPANSAPGMSAWPNPTTGEVYIAYELFEAGDVSIEVFDLVGQRLAVISSGFNTTGRKELLWNAAALSQGVYLVRLSSGKGQTTLKLVKE